MGHGIDEPAEAGDQHAASAAANPGVEADPGEACEPLKGPKLHMTGRGLSPAEYQAQHGAHDHQADFSRGFAGTDGPAALDDEEEAGPASPGGTPDTAA